MWRCCCFTLGCELFQCKLETVNWWNQQNYIICEKQRYHFETARWKPSATWLFLEILSIKRWIESVTKGSLGEVQHPPEISSTYCRLYRPTSCNNRIRIKWQWSSCWSSDLWIRQKSHCSFCIHSSTNRRTLLSSTLVQTFLGRLSLMVLGLVTQCFVLLSFAFCNFVDFHGLVFVFLVLLVIL